MQLQKNMQTVYILERKCSRNCTQELEIKKDAKQYFFKIFYILPLPVVGHTGPPSLLLVVLPLHWKYSSLVS